MYFPYALNDINGTAFDDSRKMCLIIPTEKGLIETTSGFGFIRASWDMNVLEYLYDIAESVIEDVQDDDILYETAHEAIDFIETLTERSDLNQMRTRALGFLDKLVEEPAEEPEEPDEPDDFSWKTNVEDAMVLLQDALDRG